ncbi:outer membrane beta-barrel protein [Novosphingobium sp. BL-8H]|uniref:outer membrane beta-barrel protein n=1 Tax=Novosphingobium sp. BL-8H TaxID=3127640 RepID=UPI00375806B1
MNHRTLALAVPVPLLLAAPQHAWAQSNQIGSTAPAVYPNDKDYRALPLHLGSLDVTLGGEASTLYDSNIYAAPSNARDDVRFDISPRLGIKTAPAPVTFELNASGTIRRFVTHTTENAEAWLVDGDVNWQTGQNSSLSASVFSRRAIEDRSDPEARRNPDAGPRLINSLGGVIAYHRVATRTLLDVQADVTKFNALSSIDADRDFSAYAGQATFGLRVTGRAYATATAFVARREFRLEYTLSGDKRNTTTFGGRLGINVQPGGVLEGGLSVGVFRHDPDEPTTPGHTGLSVAGNLTYHPSRRTAILLDAFNGDVATFRVGATQRTDTITKLSVQQEIRHNLYATVSAGYRKTKYTGSGIREETWTGGGEVEYLFNRNMSVAATASYGSRSSDSSILKFDRFRGGVALRLRF